MQSLEKKCFQADVYVLLCYYVYVFLIVTRST
jgi:hypothetical protein